MELSALNLTFNEVTKVILKEVKSGKHQWLGVYLYRGEDCIHFMDIFTKDGADIPVTYERQSVFLKEPESVQSEETVL